MMSRVLTGLLLAVFVLGAAGCGDSTRQPQMPTYSYDRHFLAEGQWAIHYAGQVDVEVRKSGEVVILAKPGVSTYIQVTGSGVVFQVHNADVLTVGPGAKADVYQTDKVLVQDDSEVVAHNCIQVDVWGKPKLVESYGNGKIRYMTSGSAEAPPDGQTRN